MEKIKKTEELENHFFVDLINKIITKIGYGDITQLDETCILATSNSAISVEKHLFIMFPFRLSGNIKIYQIKNIIVERQKETKASSIFIVSKYHISKGFETSLNNERMAFNTNFLGRDKTIELIDKYYPEFWRHNDNLLISYESKFIKGINNDNELKLLRLENDKYQKLIDIYIEPRISYIYEDIKTKTLVRKKVNSEFILQKPNIAVVSGGAGVGKTTFFKKLSTKLIEENSKIENDDKRSIPVLIQAQSIFDHSSNIENIINDMLHSSFEKSFDELTERYSFHIFIDSIDEFDETNQRKIICNIQELKSKHKINFYIGTRNGDSIEALFRKEEIDSYNIERFNIEQVKRFISTFFTEAQDKASNLLEALRENKIIDKLPITPLTLSLISILYEENDLEIPATITDIYDNFNTLIIGKGVVASKIEFIDVSFKERILSLYGYELLKRTEHKPLTIGEFFDFFNQYFEGKTLPIRQASLEEVLDYLIKNTGILFIKDNKWVQFSHDSYMEYYAALEIFKHQRIEKEKELVEYFFDVHWQNAATFYAGKSKDMPIFLSNITAKIRTAKNINEYLSGVLGMGYLLQALYQTDNSIRKQGVLETLELTLKANEVFMKLSSDNISIFRNYSLPILQIINIMFFYETYNSITLKEPLKISFNELMSLYKEKEDSALGFKIIQLAFTLDSKRINEQYAIEEILNTNMLRDPSLNVMVNLAFDLLGKEKYKIFKDEIKKKYHSLEDVNKKISLLPAGKLRFTNFDTISSSKRVLLIVEGKTDAEIIEHAFYVLTDGQTPYWKINISGNNGKTGSATEVCKSLSNAYPLLEDKDCVIGIFDHDNSGLQNFNGLKCHDFDVLEQNKIKKHKLKEIYGLCLPVPGEMDTYLQSKQEFNFFEIEHYFDADFLKENNMLKETAIPNIYEINNKRKSSFSQEVRKNNNPEVFRHFIHLFMEIDKITKIEIEYVV